ncbi:hypothetical protein ACSSS7_007126 [Eimeria intestinalis]
MSKSGGRNSSLGGSSSSSSDKSRLEGLEGATGDTQLQEKRFGQREGGNEHPQQQHSSSRTNKQSQSQQHQQQQRQQKDKRGS